MGTEYDDRVEEYRKLQSRRYTVNIGNDERKDVDETWSRNKMPSFLGDFISSNIKRIMNLCIKPIDVKETNRFH